MEIDSTSIFEANTTRKQSKDGRWSIRCDKGLWSVDGQNKNRVTQEAFNYFWQYFLDGEYNIAEERR